MSEAELIAVDWGTTHLRAYLLDRAGQPLASRRSVDGVASAEPIDFPAVLDATVRDWLQARQIPIVMSGMVGSRQGWVEVPYVPCPASLDDIIAGIQRVSWQDHDEVHICPGLYCRDEQGHVDVLRGEEVEVLGAIAVLPQGSAVVCLPGTHSKYLTVRNGIIERFTTHMTGELFAMLTNHGMLGRVLSHGDYDPESFERGVERAREPGGLLHHLFGVRAAVLLGNLSAHSAVDYLSGILIGHEITAAAPEEPVFLSASDLLATRYLEAFKIAGIRARLLPSDIAAAGLFRIATAMNELSS